MTKMGPTYQRPL